MAVTTPYIGQVDLGEDVVTAEIDDIVGTADWVGTIIPTEAAPPPIFEPGPVLAILLDPPYDGWVAAAEIDPHGVLLGHAPFVAEA
jgi:hypothetical protein